jgi:O-antigen ligase
MLPEGIETYAHNNYIELMVGTGIFGVLIYYLTHIIVLKDLFRASKRNMYKTLCFTFIAIIVSYIILAPTLVYYYGKHFSFLLAIASVVGRVLGQADEKVKTNQ